MVFVPEGKITQPANWKIPEVRGKVSNNKSGRERNCKGKIKLNRDTCAFEKKIGEIKLRNIF